MIDDATTIAVGWIATSPSSNTVALQARNYTHPALQDRVLVRLIRDNLTQAEDLTLETLGFHAGSQTLVGHLHNRAIGFPAWPIITDPARAHHALNLVADLNRVATLARSRPGAGRKLLEEIHTKLDNSAPHFLPTFLEEAARIFLRLHYTSYAAQYFGKARLAERTHNLPIDEQRHQMVFLEFALAGALSGKDLSAEAGSLMERHSPDDALQLFVDLNVNRIRGGLPPYANLPRDLRLLIQAAEADRLAVEVAFLESVFGSPAIFHAPQAFWNAYIKPLSVLAKQDFAVRQAILDSRILGVKPDAWIDVLEATGIADELRNGTADAAAWAQAYIRQLQTRYACPYPKKLIELLPQLKGLQGAHIGLNGLAHGLEPAILDALLQAGANVTFDDPDWDWQQNLTLLNWSEQPRRSELEYVACSEHAERAMAGIGQLLGAGKLNTLLNHSGTRKLLEMWATSHLGDEPSALEVLAEIRRLDPVLTPEGREALPIQLKQLAARLDGATLLASSLRDGLITEYTWPQLEAVADELGGGSEITVHDSSPAMGVASRGHVIWVNGEERVVEASFTFGSKGYTAHMWRYLLVDEVTCCVGQTVDWQTLLAWSDDPGTQYEIEHVGVATHDVGTYPVDGGRLAAGTVVRPGAHDSSAFLRVLTFQDGDRYWYQDSDNEIYQLDPATGQRGRKSLPTAWAELAEPQLREGYRLVYGTHMWTPVTHPESPLSQHDGRHGWLKFERSNRDIRYVDITGFVLDHGSHLPGFIGRVSRPGGGHWLLDMNGDLYTDALKQLLPTLDSIGNLHVLHKVPRSGWHQFRVRNAQVSARLRTLTADDVADLFAETTPSDVLPEPPDPLNPHSDRVMMATPMIKISAASRAAATRLLGTEDPALVDAVCWVAAQVKAIINEGLSKLDQLDATPADSRFGNWDPTTDVIAWARGSVYGCDIARAGIAALARIAAGGGGEAPSVSADIHHALTQPEVLLANACAPMMTRDDIAEAAALVASMVDTGLYTSTGAVFQVQPHDQSSWWRRSDRLVETSAGPAILLGTDFHSWNSGVRLMFFSPSGKVPAELDGNPTELVSRSGAVNVESVLSAFDVLLEQGPPAWDCTAVERLAEGTGWSRAAAALFLAGCPRCGDWEHNFLPKPMRELLGLKVAEADEGRRYLLHQGVMTLVNLYAAGASDPHRVVTEGLDIAAIIEAWNRNHSAQAQLSERMLTAAKQALTATGPLCLRKLAEAEELDEQCLQTWLWAASWVSRHDPSRGWLAESLNTLKHWAATTPVTCDDDSSQGLIRRALGLPSRQEQPSISVGAWTINSYGQWDQGSWDPTLVSDWHQERSQVESLPQELPIREQLLDRLQLLTGEFDPIAEALRVSGDGWDQDPLVSVPEVVAEVSTTHDLPEASARYWLQLLSLHNPTDKNIDQWNGWKKKDRIAAAAPLLERELIIEARRARSGRSYFLPGGWLEAAAPHLPIEVWKVGAYNRFSTTPAKPRLGIVAPDVPYRQLFTDAWQRYRDGDVPGYQELQTRRSRR